MSGSDLLRRAAETLRQHAQAATPGPWISCPQSADGQNFVVTGKDAVPAFGLEVCSHDGDHNVDLQRQQVDADLIALLGPPVALALADLLDHEAETVANAVDAWNRDPSYINQHLGGVEAHTEHMFEELLTLARVILREPR